VGRTGRSCAPFERSARVVMNVIRPALLILAAMSYGIGILAGHAL
jgi:hypothetical protein